ncbi:hypothetical protein [Deinococcus multiflagellatus]|uniref:Uncharacterized protein n=1 Tax=Deinococcus multiflagellatus TaxID=1656887 RepID=A0ABW1ZKP3_9DEIO
MTDPLAALSAALEEDPQAALVLYGHLPRYCRRRRARRPWPWGGPGWR